jgi:hypothetical protein
MDVYSFIASLAASLAWPVVAVGAILILRRPIRDLVAVVAKIKYGDFEAEFERRLEVVNELREGLRELPEGLDLQELQTERSRPVFSGSGQLKFYGAGDSQSAVLRAWARVEHATRNVAARIGLPEAQARTPLAIVRALDRANALPPEILELFNELRDLHNEAAHAHTLHLSQTLVLQFIAAADDLARALEMGGNIYLRDRADKTAAERGPR